MESLLCHLCGGGFAVPLGPVAQMLDSELLDHQVGILDQRAEGTNEPLRLRRESRAPATLATDVSSQKREAEVPFGTAGRQPRLAVCHPHIGGGAVERSGRFNADEQ